VDSYDLFIMFTDDYSFSFTAIFIQLKNHRKRRINSKIFKAQVESQHNLKIKVIRSDRGRSTTVDIPHMDKLLNLLQGSYKKMA
jgi:Flp pilus assembly protein TadB